MKTIASMTASEVEDHLLRVCEQAEQIVPSGGMVLLLISGAGRTYFMCSPEQPDIVETLRGLAYETERMRNGE